MPSTLPTFWRRFSGLVSLRALRCAWQFRFGPEFPKLQPFLRPTAQHAATYPCPHVPSCGCEHELRPDLEGGWVAVCACGDGDCPPVKLEPNDTVIYELDRQVFGTAIAGALGFAPFDQQCSAPGRCALQIGIHAPLQAPVYLCYPATEAARLREVETLIGERPWPFLLLTPAGCSPETEVALQRASCATASLELALELEPAGRFRVTCSLCRLLGGWAARFARARERGPTMRNLGRSLAALRRDLALSQPTTESPDEDAALKAFAIVQRLDSEQTLSPPSLLTTFRLFCVEALSAGQIARRLYCSKTTVLRRLAMLRDKTGADPAQFRRLSPHLAQLEEQFSDSRARHIHRKRLLYDEPDSGDAME